MQKGWWQHKPPPILAEFTAICNRLNARIQFKEVPTEIYEQKIIHTNRTIIRTKNGTNRSDTNGSKKKRQKTITNPHVGSTGIAMQDCDNENKSKTTTTPHQNLDQPPRVRDMYNTAYYQQFPNQRKICIGAQLLGTWSKDCKLEHPKKAECINLPHLHMQLSSCCLLACQCYWIAWHLVYM